MSVVMKMLAVSAWMLTGCSAWAGTGMPERGICAHRGDCFECPENTVPAFESAVRKGAQMVEFDVRRCKTGEFVICHDSTVDRTTDGRGCVADLSFSELRALDAGVKKSSRFKGVRMPTLEEALKSVGGKGVWINVHCDAGLDEAVGAAKTIRRMGLLSHAFVAAPLEYIAAARREVPEVLVCNMSRPGAWRCQWSDAETRAYVDMTVSRKCEFLQLISPCKKESLARLTESGSKANYFFCDDPEKMDGVFDMGVDFILTNNLQSMLERYRQRKDGM